MSGASHGYAASIGGGLAPYGAGRLVTAINIHFPFYLGAVVIVVGMVISSTGHKLLGEAERGQAAAAAATSGPASAAAEEELAAEEKAEALSGDAD